MIIKIQCSKCDTDLEGFWIEGHIEIRACSKCVEDRDKQHTEQIAEMETSRKGEMQTYQDEVDDLKKRIVEYEGITAVYDLNFQVPPNMVITEEDIPFTDHKLTNKKPGR